MSKKTMVIGASTNQGRYSYKAVASLLNHNHDVVPLSNKKGEVNGIEIMNGQPEIADIHTVTLYVGPANQPQYYDYILRINPQRVIFNPGTENTEFMTILQDKGIETEEACTLVLLSIGEY